MKVDLRSDTVTKPTQAMLDAMFMAQVGDDVFGEDEEVNKLEAMAAKKLGMEAALFCPSGTMTNQIGLKVLSQPYQEVICYEAAHIYKYEGGGLAGTSGLSTKLLKGDRGRVSLKEVQEAVNPDDIHAPVTSIVALENTVNKGGGSCYSLQQIKPISDFCLRHKISRHLDGARLFNALVETGDASEDYGQYFDTISICLSKGLGAPVGSLLVGTKDLIHQARRVRKYMGGGMRQAGYLAAAGIYALQNNIDRLKDDHARARKLEEVLKNRAYVKQVLPVDTNIVIFELVDGVDTMQVLAQLAEHQIYAVRFGNNEIRLVTHLDFTDQMLEYTEEVLQKLKF
ncbi:threonine aldolase family protein [Fulvivirga sediminis]|uniref:Aminotransferase class I/II-fold pyridoxal phosphate-dependent enzyme n=1 Tax=Fulvivirga sediminis TaxID=2803949 RepID=A0A937F731_9BACT|nr:GntG family PLP-dependent aldolase [Fulvivirga sediminis]MBL3656945.1 aminotransferase class I/II-fold pyridoxal phosphate-dependent enzyme [Fulvivirga sediminis]